SAEDFAPPAPSKGWPAKIGDALAGFGKATVGAIPEIARAASDLQRGTLGGDVEAFQRTGERLKGIVGAQGEQFRQAAHAPTLSEAAGHALAGVVPIVGPAAAQAGEKIGAGDDEGYGEAAALLLPSALHALPAGTSAAAGRAAVATGKAAASATKAAAPLVLPLAADAALHYMGATPVVTAAKVLGKVLDAAKERRAAAVEPPVAPATPAAPIGRVVPAQGPSLTEVLQQALAESSAPTPPARVTTAPAPELPPGYTPRTTAPKPKAAKASLPEPVRAAMERAAKPKMDIDTALADMKRDMPPKAPPSRPYFLKSEEQMAVEKAAKTAPKIAPKDISIDDLPDAWKSKTGQDIFPITGAEGKEVVRAFQQEMRARGMSPGEALSAVSNNTDLPTAVRSQLMRALIKAGKNVAPETKTAMKAALQANPSFDSISNRIGKIMLRVSEANIPDAEWDSLTSELSKLRKMQASLYPDELAARESRAAASAKVAYGKSLSGGK